MPITRVLDWERVNAMRAAFLADPMIDRTKLARQHGITQTQCSQILFGFQWKDPHYTPPTNMRKHRKLDWPTVREIRALRLQGLILQAIADRYGVSKVCIHHICAAQTWTKDPKLGIAVPIRPTYGYQRTRLQYEAAE